MIGLFRRIITHGDKDETNETSRMKALRNRIAIKKVRLGDHYTYDCLLNDMDLLMPNFMLTQSIIADLCRGITLTESLGVQLLYSGGPQGRRYRMLLFVLLLNESCNLKRDYNLAYHLFKEAYLMTDDIFHQLKNSAYPFDLTDYLTGLENNLVDRFTDCLNDEEKQVFNSIPNRITLYRGLCDEEKQSGNLGISWSLDKDQASNYVFYKMNNVKGTVGWIAQLELDKNEIFAVWGINGQRKEIIVNPKKCIGVSFESKSNN